MRLKLGHKIWLIDGEGTAYTGEITSQNGSTKGKIYETISGEGENPWYLHLAIAVLKKSRFEFLIEKATELGVNKISIIRMDRCGKQRVQDSRLKKLILSSAKQCGRSVFPEIEEFSSLTNFIDQSTDKIVAANWEGKLSLSNYLSPGFKSAFCILIGPEGDFSSNELDVLNQKKIPLVTLGSRRLRSETAGIYALSAMNEYYLNIRGK
ncbi:uncharacterized protein METZ01_LOCUS70312 [marine metagenome]|uniref:16S rRNA (uracil(1498)-N(3))-methyltransferase n=1 Tax=marine metagenome TaxID=408172 RepID=A0A381TPL4_9ZZZZ